MAADTQSQMEMTIGIRCFELMRGFAECFEVFEFNFGHRHYGCPLFCPVQKLQLTGFAVGPFEMVDQPVVGRRVVKFDFVH